MEIKPSPAFQYLYDRPSYDVREEAMILFTLPLNLRYYAYEKCDWGEEPVCGPVDMRKLGTATVIIIISLQILRVREKGLVNWVAEWNRCE